MLLEVPQDQTMWLGILDRARLLGVNLLYFIGRILAKPGATRVSSNVIYDLIHDGTVDALIVWGSSGAGLGVSLDQAEMLDFLHRYDGLPLVHVEKPLPGFPCILTDTYDSMCQIIAHLIQTHHRQRIALIRGPEGHFETEERVRAFGDTLTAHHLEVNPAIISDPCGWSEASGAEAMRQLLDQRGLRPGVDFDGLAATEIQYAVGAARELYARGVAVPALVSVVGFNDIAASEVTQPPLTTVRKPFYQSGQEALDRVLALLRGESVEAQCFLPAEMIIRRSCGCWPQEIDEVTSDVVSAASVADRRAATVAEIARTIERMLLPDEDTARLAGQWAAQLVDGLDGDADAAENSFLTLFEDAMRQLPVFEECVGLWHRVLSVMRAGLRGDMSGEQAAHAENAWHQARLLVARRVQYTEIERSLRRVFQDDTLRSIEAGLLAVNDIESMMGVLATTISRLGISSCDLALYTDPLQSLSGAQLVLAYHDGERLALSEPTRLFETRELLPAGLWPQGRPFHKIVLPLVFQEQPLGLMALEVEPREGFVYESLAQKVSNALHVILAAQQYQRVQANLMYEQSLLRALMDTVPDYVYFKDRDSRFLRISRSHARAMGLRDPSEAQGMSDFDTNQPERAQKMFEDEQEIIRTGQPKAGIEEMSIGRDGTETWISATKAPLRNEQGEIIGTFGISRNITSLKRAERDMARFATDMERRAAQLQVASEVARDTASIRQLSDLLNRVVNLICDRFGYDHAVIFLLDEQSQYAVLAAATGEVGARILARGYKLEVGEQGIVGEAIRSGQPQIVLGDRATAARVNAMDDASLWPEAHSEVVLPLVFGGRVIGALDVQSQRAAAFDEQDVVSLHMLADQLAVAIENARLFEQMQQTVRELEVASGRYTREAWREVEQVGYRYRQLNIEPSVEQSVEAQEARKSGQSVLADSLTRQLSDPESGEAVTSTLAVPIKLRNEVVGVLDLRFAGTSAPPEMVSLVEEVANRLALSLESARLLQETQRRAAYQQQLGEVTSRIYETLDIETVLKTAVQQIRQAMGLPEVVIQLRHT